MSPDFGQVIVPKGTIKMSQSGGDVTIDLNADTATIAAGRKDRPGKLILSSASEFASGDVHKVDSEARVSLSSKPLQLIFSAEAAPGGLAPQKIVLDGQTPEIRLSGSGSRATVRLIGSDASIRGGGNEADGQLLILNKDSKARIVLDTREP